MNERRIVEVKSKMRKIWSGIVAFVTFKMICAKEREKEGGMSTYLHEGTNEKRKRNYEVLSCFHKLASKKK